MWLPARAKLNLAMRVSDHIGNTDPPDSGEKYSNEDFDDESKEQT